MATRYRAKIKSNAVKKPMISNKYVLQALSIFSLDSILFYLINTRELKQTT